MARAWSCPTPEVRSAADRLAENEGIPRPVAAVLVQRGLAHADARDRFLNPRLSRLTSPASLPDIDAAVDRVGRAIDRGEPILVHGDYDVDGVSGCAFLTRMLRAMGAVVHPFVPTRDEGYGLGEAGIQAATGAGAGLVVTVDCGTASVAEIAELGRRGIDTVVLDHHEPGDALPPAIAVVNPMREKDSPFRMLSAVGVAAKFVHAMAVARPDALPREEYKEALQLVALGTIADLVSLTGENRILVAYGLERLARSRWIGVQALKASARITRDALVAADVAFSLAPRINAAGRMGNARDALALLLADDPLTAYRLADAVERMNEERRRADEVVLAGALEKIRLLGEVPAMLVLADAQWPAGVVGIAASRVLERFHRPVAMIAIDGEMGRGSARSLLGFPLPAALSRCADLLITFGGHAQAAGFTVRRDRIPELAVRLAAIAAEADLAQDPTPWDLDAVTGIDEFSPECVGWLSRLEPFGNGNPEPLFGAEAVEIAEIPSVVGGKHLRLTVRAGDRRMKAIAFHQGSRAKELDRGRRVGMVFHASFDTWRGNREIQLTVRDIRTG